MVTSVQDWVRNVCNCLDNMLIFEKKNVFLKKPHPLTLFIYLFSLSFTAF